jgi:hypothetical protein
MLDPFLDFMEGFGFGALAWPFIPLWLAAPLVSTAIFYSIQDNILLPVLVGVAAFVSLWEGYSFRSRALPKLKRLQGGRRGIDPGVS